MARKARHRITYVLPLPNSSGGHRLGVNGLVVDQERSILYSGGRDGVICSWSLDTAQSHPEGLTSAPYISNGQAAIRNSRDGLHSRAWQAPVQAHTHWINDITLAQNHSALISASSDLTVKVWRPYAEDDVLPQTVGLHSDYVKCLATSSAQPDWVASGGLDQQIYLWDLNGGGQKLRIDVGEEEKAAKGSVYALAMGGGILASGGPENIVRIWDPRSGKRVTKLVGHTDNVRDILISDYGDTVMTASSDQTVKVWSISAGRCTHTLTMHNDSVWSLYSDHPRLSVFYSSDRSGLVAKTRVLSTAEMDEGICVALCQEHQGVNKVVGNGSYVWTATSHSSINRWTDVDLEPDTLMLGAAHQPSSPSTTSHPRQSLSPRGPWNPVKGKGGNRKRVPVSCMLRLSNTALHPLSRSPDADSFIVQSVGHLRKGSEVLTEMDATAITPLHDLPEESIEGQNGLIKHIMLNDRRRVLTLDTTGEVIMWDLVKCEPVFSYGKQHLEDVASEVNTMESVANWCAVDTRTGRLACVLEENHCFDGEMYADELPVSGTIDFKEDQRINLGKWVLRYLFSGLIDEEIKRDEAYRRTLYSRQRPEHVRLPRSDHPTSIQLPLPSFIGWQDLAGDPSGKTPRAVNGFHPGPVTPGMTIGVATPAPQSDQTMNADSQSTLTGDGSTLEKRSSQHSQSRSSPDKTNDYFSANLSSQPQLPFNEGVQTPAWPGEIHDDRTLQTSLEPEKELHGKESGSLFGKKFRIPFSGKKLGRSPSANTTKPVLVDERAEDSDGSKSLDSVELITQDNFFGVVQKIRQSYDAHVRENPEVPVPAGINPSLPNETPVLKPPSLATIIIQEDRPESGGIVDLYRGTVSSVGDDADLIEKIAPMWLGELLLHNQLPLKETVKISFILQPYLGLLPSVASADGNVRLNANRMLRVRKILAYVAERIEPQPEKVDPKAMKPEEYLELYCQNQLIPTKVTLATLRAHIWKGGGDVMLFYKSNRKKKIAGEKLVNEVGQHDHTSPDATETHLTPR